MKILVNGYTVTEHLKLSINTDKDIKEMISVDKIIGNLKKNKKSYMRVVMILALIIPASTLQVFASGGIIDMGLEMYGHLKKACYVICLLGGATESIKCVVTGTIDQIGKVAIKYLAFALIIKFLPRTVDAIFGL